MKKLYVILLLLCIGTAAACAKKPQKAKPAARPANPKTEVLLTLREGERVYGGEYFSLFSVEGYRFSCVLQNERTGKYSLVWNGERIIDDADYLYFYHLDRNDLNKCTLEWVQDKNSYIRIEEKVFGPYQSVIYNYPYSSLKNEFEFEQMGTWYTCASDGTIYETAKGRPVYTSPNGQHRAVVDESWRKITVDGQTYDIPLPDDEYISISDRHLYVDAITPFTYLVYPHVFVCDDGNCYYAIPTSKRQYEELPFLRHDYFITTQVKELADDEVFNYELQQLQNFQSFYDYRDSPAVDGELFAYELFQSQAIQDKTKTHFFTSSYDYDYVLIDGQPYGKGCPLEAFYDEAAHAYVWVAVEQNRIVRYTYAL